jgi:hypothetical protein
MFGSSLHPVVYLIGQDLIISEKKLIINSTEPKKKDKNVSNINFRWDGVIFLSIFTICYDKIILIISLWKHEIEFNFLLQIHMKIKIKLGINNRGGTI